jgi:hypothetical protein
LEKLYGMRTEGICPFCNTRVRLQDFNDPLSKREFIISGLCQKCQDNFFEKY